MNALQQHLEPSVRRQQRNDRLAAAFMLILGVIGLVWALRAGFKGDRAMARMLVLSSLCIPLAAIMGLLSLRKHRGLSALGHPERIVWYYGISRGPKPHAVMIGFEDRQLHRLPLPLISLREGFSQQVFGLLRAAAPNATAGFSEENRVAYRRNPSSLRKP